MNLQKKHTLDFTGIFNLLDLIKKGILKKISQNITHLNSYKNMILQLSSLGRKLNEDELKNNFINETSYFVFLCFLYSEYLNYHFQRKLSWRFLAGKLDVQGVYSWYKVTGKMTNEIVKLIDENLLNSLSIEYFSDFYESLLDNDEKKRLGQFYTPEEIVDLIVLEAGVNFDNIDMTKTIIDPACGAGVFLTRIVSKINKEFSYKEVVDFVYSNLYGNDINPFAVVLTKLNLTFNIISRLNNVKDLDDFLENYSELPNISLKNTLLETDDKNYDIIVGNPPYFKTTNDDSLLKYQEIIYGQPNVYGLFLYWALKHVSIDGIVSFIIPQSFKSGLYFLKLRKLISELEIVSLINFKSRTKIFKNVEQAVVILTIRNSLRKNTNINIVNKIDSKNKETFSFETSMDNVIMSKQYNYFIFIPSSNLILNLINKIYTESTNLKEEGNYLFGTGGFVWNQHKSLLESGQNQDSLPIIYAGFIDKFNFLYNDFSINNSEKKQFARFNEKIKPMITTGQKLIVQRTSTFEDLQRIKSCLIKDDFLNMNPTYLLENHVNFLYDKKHKDNLIPNNILKLYLGLINSKLLNIIFSVKNGNTQVSSSELNLLPISYKNQSAIIEMVNLIEMNPQSKLIDGLDEIIYENYSLTSSEIDIIRNYSR